jgi:tRNA(Ile)-lysidine synthase
MEEDIRRFVADNDLLLPPRRAVVGVSGGVDSVVLCKLLLRLGVDIHAVHVNYQLRGGSSDEDETFVRAMCDSAEVPLTVFRRPIAASVRESGASMQAEARRVRYELFERVAASREISRVALGHQKDDQIETVLLQLIRGTGLRGLAGMPIRRPITRGGTLEIVRPLLWARRSEIESFALDQGWDWREDRSNRSKKYLRTALRRDVIPPLEKHAGPSAVENIARTSQLMREYWEQEWHPRLEADLERCVEVTSDNTVMVSIAPLEEASRIWCQEILLEIVRRYMPETPVSEAIGEELADLLHAQVGRRKSYATHTVWRERGRLTIVPRNRGDVTIDQTLVPGDTVMLPGGRQLRAERLPEVPEDPESLDAGTALLDADALHLPLRVRLWREGDRFRPLGMDGHKNVSDLLTEAKVPPHERNQVCVVTSNDTVVWIVGYRMAHEVRLRPETERVLQLTVHE